MCIGIQKPSYGLDNKRGSRGGTKQRRCIPVIEGRRQQRTLDTKKDTFSINRSALITVCDHKNSSIHNTTFATINARSIGNKVNNIRHVVQDCKLDIVTITDTWFSDSTSYNASLLCPSGFSIFRTDRVHGPGGGVAVLCRDIFKPSQIFFSQYASFDYCAIKISSGPQVYHILAIYRPQQTSNSVFQTEFSPFIEETCIGNTPVLLSGDLNIHFDNPTIPMTQSYI